MLRITPGAELLAAGRRCLLFMLDVAAIVGVVVIAGRGL